ncbi:hypothetical protein C2G38_2186087 [Gigaspora rosea]|uniref:Uncharacterized protein n=1 Tax=Gigaspora rosea TaxID=44941 RepID=A0A397V8A7_9GLOM|nr:hypothetical protein C2G38_2186087 [Gigaspora rosea]
MGPNVGVAASQAQQNFSGYRPVGSNMRPPLQVVAGIPSNTRPLHVTGGRPPTHFAPQIMDHEATVNFDLTLIHMNSGLTRPTIPVQQGSTTGILPGPRLPMAPPSAGPGYQPTSPQQIQPPLGNEEIDNILPHMSNVRISQDPNAQNPSQIDVMYFISPNFSLLW